MRQRQEIQKVPWGLSAASKAPLQGQRKRGLGDGNTISHENPPPIPVLATKNTLSAREDSAAWRLPESLRSASGLVHFRCARGYSCAFAEDITFQIAIVLYFNA